jgi:hypothetical protein
MEATQSKLAHNSPAESLGKCVAETFLLPRCALEELFIPQKPQTSGGRSLTRIDPRLSGGFIPKIPRRLRLSYLRLLDLRLSRLHLLRCLNMRRGRPGNMRRNARSSRCGRSFPRIQSATGAPDRSSRTVALGLSAVKPPTSAAEGTSA